MGKVCVCGASALQIDYATRTMAVNGSTYKEGDAISINGTVGERVFDFPIKSQVKLPDLKALFKEIDDNQKAIDKIKENYAGTETEAETYGRRMYKEFVRQWA